MSLWHERFEETPIPFILTFDGASIRAIRNFRRWAGCRDHNLLLRAALEGTHFFWAKTDMPPKNDTLLGLLQLAKRQCPFKLYRNSVQGDVVNSKSYCTNAKTHRDQASWVTDMSPDLTTCDTERRSPTHYPLAHAPRDEITACDQVPKSDFYRKKKDVLPGNRIDVI